MIDISSPTQKNTEKRRIYQLRLIGEQRGLDIDSKLNEAIKINFRDELCYPADKTLSFVQYTCRFFAEKYKFE